MAVLWPSVSQDEKVSQSFFAVWSACIKTSLDPLPEAPSGLLILGREDLALLLNRRCGSRGKFRKDWLQPWPVFSVSPDRSRAQAHLRVSFAAAVLNFFPGGGDLALNHPQLRMDSSGRLCVQSAELFSRGETPSLGFTVPGCSSHTIQREEGFLFIQLSWSSFWAPSLL